MALIKFLAMDERPPEGERFLLIVRRERKGIKVVRHDSATQRRPSFTYQVGPDKWAFWFAEGPALADRLGLGRVYVRRQPVVGPDGAGQQRRTASIDASAHGVADRLAPDQAFPRRPPRRRING